jgi:hypothetical protein
VTAPLPTLEQHLAWVRRHLRLLLVFCVLGTAVGFGLASRDERIVTAESSLLITRIPTYLHLTPDMAPPKSVTIDTDAAMLRSAQVDRAVEGETGMAADEVQDHLGVTATPASRVLHVSFTASDADTAVNGAAAAAREFLDQRSRLLAGAARDTLPRLRDDLAQRRDVINAVRAGQAATSPDEVLLNRLQFQIRFLDGVRSGNRDMGRVLTAAHTTGPASTVNPEVKISGGAMVGLLLGLCAALGLDARRRRWSPLSAPPGPTPLLPQQRGVDQSPEPQRGLARR